MTSLECPIPLIDFESGESLEAIGEKIKDAIEKVGFLHVKGAGITQEDVNAMFSVHEKLFKSPVEELMACKETDHGGYSGFKKHILSEAKDGTADSKSSFVYGRYPSNQTHNTEPLPPVYAANKVLIDGFHAKCYEASCLILDAFSLAMKLPKDYFRKAHRPGMCALSMLDYPALSKEEADKASRGGSRAGAHKDWGSLTLLFQEEFGTPGLEIFLADDRLDPPKKTIVLSTEIDYSKGTWYKAPIIPGTFLVNIGSALEAWTGGRYKATLHQVSLPPRNPDGSTNLRRSIAFFVQPREEAIFNPVSPDWTVTVTTDAPTSEEFYLARRRATRTA